ncbi:hypothetical protein AGMMS49521_3280 [Campylobacterota bacterium]|nr:hypothetical protein AGMMS49521_3280 [Campylobacterota bacterium]
MDKTHTHNALGRDGASQLSDIVKTRPQFGALTPRWVTKVLEFKGLETGIYRVNRVVEGDTPLDALCSQDLKKTTIPQGYIEYETKPREYRLNSISAIINVDTRIADLYGKPYDQSEEQLALAIESVKERQESQIINNDEYGLLHNVEASQRIEARYGRPMPDDLDELLTKVWKDPSFFLAHPRAIAAFERECTRRGVPPVTVNIAGGTFISWRGVG